MELEKLYLHAGYRHGRGYVHEVHAASELLEEALQPYLDEIGRLAGLGLPLQRKRSRQACCSPSISTEISSPRTRS
jgi:hypothetical protein